MIECQNISFSYQRGGTEQIRSVSMKVEEGYLTGLLGPNGSGKTTLLKLLNGSLLPGSGMVQKDEIRLSASNLWEYRNGICLVSGTNLGQTKRIGKDFLPLLTTLYPDFSEADLFRYLEQLDFGMKHLSDLAQLSKFYNDFSDGEKMKISLCFALAAHPKYLLLDEPFAHLDPVVRIDLMELLHRKVIEKEMGVLISTHLIDEISDMMDQVAVIKDGKLLRFTDRESLLKNGDLDSALHEIWAAGGTS